MTRKPKQMIRSGKSASQAELDDNTIQSLRKAALDVSAVADQLRSNEGSFQATNLPVADAVAHVLSCLEKDAAYLKKLADICAESAPVIRKIAGD